VHNIDVFLLCCIAVVCIALPPDAPRAARFVTRGFGILFVMAAISALKAVHA
jgi:hypothetical protein